VAPINPCSANQSTEINKVRRGTEDLFWGYGQMSSQVAVMIHSETILFLVRDTAS